MFIEPTITWVPSGFSGYIWLDRKIVLKKKVIQIVMHLERKQIKSESPRLVQELVQILIPIFVTN